MNEEINEAINNFDNEIARIFREQNTGPTATAPTPDASFRTRLISIADAIDERLGGEIG